MSAVTPALISLAADLWVADRPFKLPLRFGDIGCRMTVIRLADGGLFLHSPVPLDAALRAALDQIGPVRCAKSENNGTGQPLVYCARQYLTASSPNSCESLLWGCLRIVGR